jgi:hypothetical protein
MRFHRAHERVFLDVAVLPSGNVHVLAPGEAPLIPTPRPERPVAPQEPEAGRPGWVIHDATGLPLGPQLATRAEALRHMGSLARRGVDLPLTLSDPDGRYTGDQLA